MQGLDEFMPLTDFFFSGDVDYAAVAKELIPKERTPKQVAEMMLLFCDGLDVQRDLSAAGLEAFARAFGEQNNWPTKELFMLLRLGATAKKATPPLFESLAGLGRELTRRRLRLCAEFVQQLPAPVITPSAASPSPAPAK